MNATHRLNLNVGVWRKIISRVLFTVVGTLSGVYVEIDYKIEDSSETALFFFFFFLELTLFPAIRHASARFRHERANLFTDFSSWVFILPRLWNAADWRLIWRCFLNASLI